MLFDILGLSVACMNMILVLSNMSIQQELILGNNRCVFLSLLYPTRIFISAISSFILTSICTKGVMTIKALGLLLKCQNICRQFGPQEKTQHFAARYNNIRRWGIGFGKKK